MPDHFLVWNKFCDLLPAGSVLVASNAKGVTRVRVGEEFARAGIHTLRASSQGASGARDTAPEHHVVIGRVDGDAVEPVRDRRAGRTPCLLLGPEHEVVDE